MGQRSKASNKRFDVLVVGDINPDIIVIAEDPVPVFGQAEKYVDAVRLVIGGSSAIFACGASRLGLRTAIVGVVGDDVFGHYMLGALQDHGVDVSACIVKKDVATGVGVILSGPKDRAILTAKGTIGAVSVSHVPDSLLRDSGHLHLGSYYLLESAQPQLPALFRKAVGAGLTTSFDCNWDPLELWDDRIDALLQQTDVFFPNAAEAQRLTGEADPLEAARQLLRRGGSGPRGVDGGSITVALKQGAAGALGLSRHEALHVAAMDVSPVDTTGAGDSFDAGFLFGWLQGSTLSRCLEIASICGSQSTLGRGGTEFQLTVDQLLAIPAPLVSSL